MPQTKTPPSQTIPFKSYQCTGKTKKDTRCTNKGWTTKVGGKPLCRFHRDEK